MARAYYALVAGLPDLLLDEGRLQHSLADFRSELADQLREEDYRLIGTLFYHTDNANLLALLDGIPEGTELDAGGNFSRELLEEEIRVPGSLPGYMGRFIEEHRNSQRLPDGMIAQDRLTSLMYEDLLSEDGGLPTGFVRDWFVFERDLRNVLVALACRSLDRSPAGALIGENHVVESILKANSGDFGLGRELPWLEKVLQLYGQDDLLAREKGIDLIRWETADDMTTFEYFTINKVAAYVVKLGIALRWLALDEETGRELFSRIMQDLESGFEFPAEFSVRGGRKHANNG